MGAITRNLQITVLNAGALNATLFAGAVPQLPIITYQGRLAFNGEPLNTTADLQFSLWVAPVGGSQVGATQEVDNVSVVDGLFTVELNFGDEAFDGSARWLEIAACTPSGCGVFTSLTPRQSITAAPYAVRSLAPWETVASGITYSDGLIGVGTASPLYPLHLQRSDAVRLLYVNNFNNDPGTTYAAYARVTGDDGIAVYGVHDSVGGIAPAIRGETDSTAANAVGVHGLVDTTTAGSFSAAVRGENLGTGFSGIGVWGSHDGGGWGVYGLTNGALGRGVYGRSTASGGVGGWFDSDGGAALVADGVDNNGSNAAVRIVSGGQTMLLDGNEIDADAGLYLNNNNSQDVVIAAGGGDVVLGQSFLNAGFFVLDNDAVAPSITIGDQSVTVQIDDTGMNLFDDLTVVAANETPLTVNRNSNDGTLVWFEQDGAVVGTISVAGAVVSYNAFTGSHFAWLDESQEVEPGALVRLTGSNRRMQDNLNAEIIYGVTPTATANDPACLGAYLGPQDPAQPINAENPLLVAAVGNGELWVTQINQGDIQPGDSLISSDISGCAMKDDPQRFPIGYVVARAAEAVDWSTIEPIREGVKRAKISVLFENFVRNSEADQLKQRVQALETELASLREAHHRMVRLERLMNDMATRDVENNVARVRDAK